PKLYKQYIQTKDQFPNLSLLHTPTFLFPMPNPQTLQIQIHTPKPLIIKLQTITQPHHNAKRTIYYPINAQATPIYIQDQNVKTNPNVKPNPHKSNPNHIPPQIPPS
ncbi:hypothetical protein, partial [Staphylococcus epidermidis]|uniref:hypothetical protein n=1 Tax=Staphylococcus epidermidis TaxID=1282 RepID=UPI001C92F00B